MVVHLDPVTHLHTIAVQRNRLAVQRVGGDRETRPSGRAARRRLRRGDRNRTGVMRLAAVRHGLRILPAATSREKSCTPEAADQGRVCPV